MCGAVVFRVRSAATLREAASPPPLSSLTNTLLTHPNQRLSEDPVSREAVDNADGEGAPYRVKRRAGFGHKPFYFPFYLEILRMKRFLSILITFSILLAVTVGGSPTSAQNPAAQH